MLSLREDNNYSVVIIVDTLTDCKYFIIGCPIVFLPSENGVLKTVEYF